MNDITILITTFLRPGYLTECLQGIAENLPECEVSVACDDNEIHMHVSMPNYMTWTNLPYDSGLTPKRNAAVREARTKYCLLGCDDFNFRPPYVREGIGRLRETLEAHPEVDVAVGTYNNIVYERMLEYVPGQYIKEHAIDFKTPLFTEPYPAFKIELGINYFLARTSVLREVPWDERIVPIGGEHGDWYMDMKMAGKNIVFVPDCKIESMPNNGKWKHPKYDDLRLRSGEGHAALMKKWNIEQYRGPYR